MAVRIGLGKVDITPRVGVELMGFGPFITRHSRSVRDRLWARAMAVNVHGRTLIVVSCDLVFITMAITREVRRQVREATGTPESAVMVHATHTHSGPNPAPQVHGWGEADAPYVALLPGRIAQACIQAVEDLAPARLAHAEVPCEGVGLNREYDRDAPPLEDVLRDDWRPAKPELTDTTVHVLRIDRDDRPGGFIASFSCHPVVCCAQNDAIHGDYCGVAMTMLERETPGAVGLFLQGAQGDVNSCVVHKGKAESMLALDVIASRFARSVREGLRVAQPIDVDQLACATSEVTLTARDLSIDDLQRLLAEREATLNAPDASDDDRAFRMAAVEAGGLRQVLDRAWRGESLDSIAHLQGLRLGPIALLAAPMEVFQAIKRDVLQGAHAPVPLVLGITNDLLGYAHDRTVAERGGYAVDIVPMIVGLAPLARVHDELAAGLIALDAELAASPYPA